MNSNENTKYKDKNVLLIMPKYFGYETEVEDELKSLFSNVYVIYENITDLNYFYDVVYHHFSDYSQSLFFNYYKRQLKKIPSNIDYVFVIRGFSINERIISFMKNKFKKNTKYILWQWDSVKNNYDILNITKCFDKVLTFDIEDSKKYKFDYRPNFYLNINRKLKIERDIDLLYIGSFSFDRYGKLLQFKKIAEEKKLKLYTVLYISRFTFYLQKYILRNKEYVSIKKEDLSFKSLSIKEVYDLYAKSKIVIEITSKTQTGYTMRSIDCLVNRCKLITNNKYLTEADFYSQKNIFVLNNEDINIPNNFINSSYKEIDNKIINNYSIDKWLLDTIE